MEKNAHFFLLDLLKSRKSVKIDDIPYVVLVGNVGAGKSTIFEKVTGATNRSSSNSESFTKSTEYSLVRNGSLAISDTPGANPRKDKWMHNMNIASALSFRKVSKIFIVVKADTRIDTTLDFVRTYADRFVSLPKNSVSVLVTHMDTVKWSQDEFLTACYDELGFEEAVFSGTKTLGTTIISAILEVCKEEYDINVDTGNFLRLFKIHDHNRKILNLTSDQVEYFKRLREGFEVEKIRYKNKDLVDLYFEFQAFMSDQITKAQKVMSDKLKFTFEGEMGLNESGHIANMTNQLRAVLYDVRTQVLFYQNSHGITELRKCPHCGKVWAKMEGCDGNTTCGKRPSSQWDLRDPSYSVNATFTFQLLKNRLRISKNGEKPIKDVEKSSEYYGCGREINWGKMSCVEVPPEFSIIPNVTTDDVKMLPPTQEAEQTYVYIKHNLEALKENLGEFIDQSAVTDPSEGFFTLLNYLNY